MGFSVVGAQPDSQRTGDHMTRKLVLALSFFAIQAAADGEQVADSGLLPDAAPDSQYIRVDLARPVPQDGRGRVLIDKTYEDAASYAPDGDRLTFSRTLGVKRNAVTLPPGYELTSVNYPSQVITRAGMDRYLNIVRPGSKASEPSARVLDTGDELEVEILQGAEITQRDIDIGEQVTEDTELVVIWFEPVPEGGSTLLRITETYTDPQRFFPCGDEFVWDRSFGRSRNTVVLPAGWYLSANAVPATVRTRDDGRIELVYANDRPGNIDVFIKGRRRAGGG